MIMQKLCDEARKLVNESEITLLNAYELTRLSLSDQPRFLEEAKNMSFGQFSGLVKQLLYKDAK